MTSYSANDEFKKLCQNLGFKFVVIDDPSFKGVQIRDIDKYGDIDAFIYEKNVVCAVGINKGSSDHVESEINNFFQKLDRRYLYSDLDLEVIGSQKNDSALKRARKELNNLNTHFRKFKAPTYKEVFIKIFFCPYKSIQETELEKRRVNNEIIIDRDVYDYLTAVSSRLPKQCLINDFYYLIGLKKMDLSRNVSSRARKPDKIRPMYAERLEIDKKLTVFTLCPAIDDIYNQVTVRRISNKYDKKGFQRMVKSSRLAKINKDYLSKNKTFPNNVIAAMNPEFYVDEHDFFNKRDKTLSFYDEFNSLFIIDGQHRFYSFVSGNKLDRQIILSLLFFKHKKDDQKFLQMDRMFYEINKKSERIDPNLAFSLLAKIDTESEENFWYLVFSKLLIRSSLFKNRFTFKESTIKEADKKSIISVIQYGGTLKLNKSIIKRGLQVPGLENYYSGKKRSEKIEFATTLLQNYFEVIEKIMHEQNFRKEDLTPRDIGAFLRLLYHFTLSKPSETERFGEVKKIIRSDTAVDRGAVTVFHEILKQIDFNDLKTLDLSQSNWAAVEGYLLKKININDSGFGNKNILSKKGLEIYNEEI
jgi:DGQHR domain-containing protein